MARQEIARSRHEILEEPRVVELRGARKLDVAALAALAWDVAPRPGVMERRLSSPAVRVVAALHGGRVVGVTTARMAGGGRAVSEETVVDSAWRGHGLAAKLLDAMVARLRAAGVRLLEGESSGRKQRELRFFRRYGFRITGVWIAHGEEGYAPVETLLRTELLVSRVNRAGAAAGPFAAGCARAPARARWSRG